VFIKPIFFSKYGIQTFLFFILLIAQGLAIPLDSGWKKVIAVVLVCILTIPQIGRCDLAFEKTKWREVIQVINAKAQKDDLLLINPYFMTSSVRIYLNRPIETMSWDSFAAHKAWETKRNQHIWVLTTGSKVDIKEDFKNKFSLLLPVYALDKTDSFRNISLMEFEIK